MRALLIILLLAVGGCWDGGGGSSSPPPRDTTAPIITLLGDNPQFIEAGTAYSELGATATDNEDGDLTGSIVIDAGALDTAVPGDYTVTYEAVDAAGNTGTAARTVTVEDTTAPVITLLGDDPQVIIAGNAYTELGATASDSLDGDLTGAITIDTSAVDTTMAGAYTVTYDVSDAAGNAATTVTRTVRVDNPPLPSEPSVTVEGDIKRLIFSWDASSGTDFYRLLENADGHSGLHRSLMTYRQIQRRRRERLQSICSTGSMRSISSKPATSAAVPARTWCRLPTSCWTPLATSRQQHPKQDSAPTSQWT